jgi:DNA-directed RNA polymerase specialized sigma subunit
MAKIPIFFSDFTDRVAGGSALSSTGVFADRIDLLRSRADILSGKDKELVLMYLERGVTFQQIATIMGVHRCKIARRINKLFKVLLDDEYVICVRNRHQLSRDEQKVARDYFIEGLPQTKIVKKRDFTRYHVKKCLRRIHWIIRTEQRNADNCKSKGGMNYAGV